MEHHWYKNIVIYTIDVKTFYDSNGDGIGDLKGVISKLDYLNDLGVTCIWLLPFFPSPLKDNGYDVTNYFDVDPRLGTLEDFHDLVRKVSERGIHVVIDLVMNHTSDEHPWFLAAKNDSQSIFKDYYVWTEIPPPKDPLDTPAFPDSEHGLWKFEKTARAYYYHKFYSFQPDLQIANPTVREEIKKVMDFWISQGVSGFRLDAAPIMIKKKGLERTRPSNSHEIICEMRKFLKKRREGSILLGEVDVDGTELIDYFANGGGLQLVFNFLLNAYLIGAITEEKAETLVRGWRELPIIPDSGNWVNFLRNLDELNINQLPASEKKIVFDLLAPDKNMQVYGRGIRRRLASMLQGNKKRIEMAQSLLFSLPGTPMIVYGDEIGMGENLDLWERESVRTPMQWDDSKNAGFSECETAKLYRPLVKDPDFHCKKINVAAQLKDEESLLNKIKKLIYVRKIHPEIGHGRIAWVSTNDPGVLGHICHWKNDMLLAVHNLASRKAEVVLDLRTVYAKKLKNILGSCEAIPLEDGNYRINLAAYEYAWFSVHYEKGE
ncbi:MAG: alpha-amylase family protein [Bacteriovoracia bacterium]